MRLTTTAICIAMLAACSKHEKPQQAANPQDLHVLVAPPRPAMGSAAFHLELGAVYHRYGGDKEAAEHFDLALKSTQDSSQRLQALLGIADAKEASGDADGAVAALEQAVAAQSSAEAVSHLAQLYAANKHVEKAFDLCDRAAAATPDAWQRDQIIRAEVAIARGAGQLPQRIAAKRGAIDARRPDEVALRFLVAALDTGTMGASGAGAVAPEVIAAYERLRQLHPADEQLRQELQAAYERAGRSEDAIRIAARAPVEAGVDCQGAFATPAESAKLHALSEALRIHAAAGERDKALADAKAIAAASGSEGVAASLLAARSYADLGVAPLAAQALAKAAAAATSPDDARKVALARASVADRTGNTGEADALRAGWKKSEDACLRLASTFPSLPSGPRVALRAP
ncbi:MAG TPA: hypothetical protein VGH20_11140 [Myxococcales bacterium]|jgi:tetratricopeptide (TPR) repeat protein